MDFKPSTLEQSMNELTLHAPPGKSTLNSRSFLALTQALSLANEKPFFFCEGSGPAQYPWADDLGCPAGIPSRKNEVWRNGSTIIYAFCDGSKVAQDKVKETIKIWGALVNLQFQHETDISKETHVRISFNGRRNWCKDGRRVIMTSTEPTMTLGSITEHTKAATDQEKRMILHVWGHLLGLRHEHQSQHLGVAWDKDRTKRLFTNYFSNDPPPTFDQWLNKNVFSVPPNTNYSDFDSASIMTCHLPSDCYILEDDEHFSMSLNLDENFELSLSDKAYMAIHYPRKPEDTESSVWKEALLTLNIPPAVSVGWNHENVIDKFWRYVTQLRNPRFKITVLRTEGLLGGDSESYNLVTSTNFWDFEVDTEIEKEYSDFDVFRTELMKKGWTLPELPPDTEEPDTKDYQVKFQALKAFFDKIAESIASQDDDIRKDVCIFLQGQPRSGERA